MRIDKLEIAIEESERFLARAKAARKKLKENEWAKYGCKETASAKRASLDLTRALSDLRRP